MSAPHECLACGGWSPGETCSRCGSALDEAPRGTQPTVRVLVDLIVDADASLSWARAWCARLPWLESERPGADAVGPEGRCPFPADPEAWAFVRHQLESAVRAHVHEDLARIGSIGTPPPLAVGVRLHNQCPGLDLTPFDGPATRVVPFDAAVAANAAALDAATVAWDLGTPDLRLRAGHEAPQLAARFASAVTIERVVVRDPIGVPRGEARILLDARPDADLLVPFPPLRARDLRELRAAAAPWQLAVHLRGRDAPLVVPVPTATTRSLPSPDARVDLFLHPGSASCRFLLAASAGAAAFPEVWSWRPAAEMQAALDLPAFDKSTAIDRPDALGTWVAAALPRLAAWVQRAHGAWLDRLVIATPGGTPPALAAAPAVRAAAEASLLGDVVAMPEALAVAAHYRAPLRALAALLVEHRRAHAALVSEASRRLAWWEDQRRKLENPFYKHFLSDPGPRPEPAPPFTPLELVPTALADALEARPEVDRLLLVDAGGEGVDIATLTTDGCRSRRVAWDADALTGHVRVALDELATAPYVTVLTGGALRDRARVAVLFGALEAAGLKEPAPVAAAWLLGEMARALRARGRSDAALDRLQSVQEKGGDGHLGRFDVVDGLRA